MITRLYAKGYGCLRDVATPPLTPIHAFIGPNDSGKSTLLRAVRVLTQLAGGELAGLTPFDPRWTFSRSDLAAATPAGLYHVAYASGNVTDGVSYDINLDPLSVEPQRARSVGMLAPLRGEDDQPARLTRELRLARLVRLDPDHLRLPGALIQEGQPVDIDERGTGLAAVYDALINRSVESFLKISASLQSLFPAVKSIRMQNPTTSTKAIAVELTTGELVSATDMSEGLLYYLAFAALPYLAPTAITLVEEPENGLHPARIREVMAVLRAMSAKTQVLIATHSPLVVNELQGHEVSVVTRTPEEGTKVRLLSDTPNFAERSKVYSLGELWVSYADGEQENPLFTPPVDVPDDPPEWTEPAGR